MEQNDQVKDYCRIAMRFEKMTTSHLAVLMGILQLTRGDIFQQVSISRSKVMKLAHIKSYVTYHKCIRELQQWEFIDYLPSYHPAIGSLVMLLRK